MKNTARNKKKTGFPYLPETLYQNYYYSFTEPIVIPEIMYLDMNV